LATADHRAIFARVHFERKSATKLNKRWLRFQRLRRFTGLCTLRNPLQ